MKISKEKLQQMIMEELALLDEKINIKVGSSDDAIEKALGLNPKDEPWKSTDLDKWQKFAKAEKPNDHVTNDDFEANFKKAGGIYKKMAKQAALQTADPSVLDDLRLAMGISPTAATTTALGGEKLASKAKDLPFDKLSRGQRAASIPSVDMPYSALVGDSATGVGGATKLNAAGKLDPSTLDAFQAFYKIDPQKLGATDSKDTLGGRFAVLSKFASALKLIKKSPTSKPAKDALKQLKSLEAEDLMACAVVLKTLGGLFNLFQGASAGTVFEGLIALVTSGVIYGGEGGAVDNLAGLNGDVYTSAKQYKDSHTTSQALGGDAGSGSEGLIAHCAAAKKKNKVVWYISAKKAEKGSKTDLISSVELLFVGVGVDDATAPTKFIFYHGDGRVTGDEVTIADAKQEAGAITATTWGKWDFSKYSNNSRTRFQIPFVAGGEDPTVENIDKMIASSLKRTGKAFLEAAMDANNKIDDIAKETLSYSTTGASKRASEMRTKYIALKKDFNIMFSAKSHKQLAENKKNEINSLKVLDKLIEQVILYKNTEEK